MSEYKNMGASAMVSDRMPTLANLAEKIQSEINELRYAYDEISSSLHRLNNTRSPQLKDGPTTPKEIPGDLVSQLDDLCSQLEILRSGYFDLNTKLNTLV